MAARTKAGRLSWRIVTGLGAALLLAFLSLPLLALFFRVPPRALVARMADPAVLDALRLSLVTSASATALVIILGLPLAYILATWTFPGRRAVEIMLTLPIVLPPTVAGVGLLLAFGRAGLTGHALAAVGITLPFSTLGVVLAEAFVAAPFFVLPAAAGLREVDPRYLDAAATARAYPSYMFFRVMLPLALPSIAAGAGMAWARALGEFGATITFAGNLPGVTQTMPLAVYLALQSDIEGAVTLSVLLVIVSIGLLIALGRTPFGSALPRPSAPRPRR